MNNAVGLDWDNITLDIAQQRQQLIERQENTGTLLYQTKHGFHLELIYPHDIAVEDNFKIREKYWDCPRRLEYSKKRYLLTGDGYDILFTCKQSHWRQLV